MIKIERSEPVPAELKKQKVRNHLKNLCRLAHAGSLSSDDFNRYWTNANVRKSLWKLQRAKCCYTERRRNYKLEMDVEHYRPKASVQEEGDHPGYWWLAYEWTNYLLSDKFSNVDKSDHFPLMRNGTRAFLETDDLDAEYPVLLNPYEDDPEGFIAYKVESGGRDADGNTEWWVVAHGIDRDGRGQRTIDLLKLNDFKLVQERGQDVDGLDEIARQMLEAIDQVNREEIGRLERKIKRQTAPKVSFAGFKRWYFKDRGLSDFVYAT